MASLYLGERAKNQKIEKLKHENVLFYMLLLISYTELDTASEVSHIGERGALFQVQAKTHSSLHFISIYFHPCCAVITNSFQAQACKLEDNDTSRYDIIDGFHQVLLILLHI